MSGVASLRKNGLVIFGSRLASIVTGWFFLLMVTGWLNPARFGLWEIITDYVTFASYPAGLLSFWATREVARGKLVGKALFVCNLGLSGFGIGIYGLFTLAYGGFGSDIGPFLLALLLVPLAYWNQAAASVAIGSRPSMMGYSLLVSEAAKLVVAYPALYIYHLEISGVVLAIIVSYFVQSLVIMVGVSGALSGPIDFGAVRRWLNDIWVPVLYLIPSQLGIADTFVASAATGSTDLAGYYQAAFSLALMVSYAGLLASALYPLLVKGGRSDAPSVTLDLVLMFAIPMAVGNIALAPTFLALLRAEYVAAATNVTFALGVLSLWGLLVALSLFTDNTLLGLETADVAEKRSFGGYMRSSFGFVSGVNSALLVVFLVGVFFVVTIGRAAGIDPGMIVAYWAILQFAILLPGVALKLRRVRSKTSLRFPRALPAYILSSAVMAAVLLMLAGSAPPPGSDRIPLGEAVLGLVGVGAGVYFAVLFALDGGFRRLVSSVFRSLGRSQAPITATGQEGPRPDEHSG